MEFTKKQLIEEAKQSIKACHTIMRVSPNIDAHKISLRLAEIALASLEADSDSSIHPAHGSLSNDRLHRIREILGKAAAQSDGGNLGYAMSDAVKAIDELLDVRVAKPVHQYQSGIYNEDNGETDWYWDDCDIGFYEQYAADRRRILYTAPPVPDEMTMADAIMEIDAKDADRWTGRIGFQKGWNACRAAMLNHSGRVTDMVEHVSQPYKLPPHVYRELVNQLHSTAMKYSGCQQLREQISRTLGTVLGPAHSHIK